MQPLLQLNSDQFGAYILGFEVYYRKKKVSSSSVCFYLFITERGISNGPRGNLRELFGFFKENWIKSYRLV